MASIVMAYIAMAFIPMTYTFMAYIAMACIVMACIGTRLCRTCRCTPRHTLYRTCTLDCAAALLCWDALIVCSYPGMRGKKSQRTML